MRQTDAIFVLIDELEILAPAIRAYCGGERIELTVARTAHGADCAVEDAPGAITIVSMVQDESPGRAVRLARKGARVVICAAANADRQRQLRALAPTNFILNASSAEELARALRAALG